jgi:glucose/arabinose dehydrogenase
MKITILLILISGLLISTGYQTPPEGQEAAAWPVLDTVLVAGNLDSPVHITHSGDGSGRLFVVEQPGMIKILLNGSIQGTFLDISDRVRSIGNEEGLLSLAFPPGYGPSLPYFYVYYTQQDGNNIVSRFSISVNPDLADPTSEEKILVLPHPTFSNHNGGQIAFGPDDYLYIATGDGGGGGDPQDNAQNPGLLLGKLLRIDVSEGKYPPINGVFMLYLPLSYKSGSSTPTAYSIPPDNPFVGSPGFQEEIWALGLRNPWRFSFDRQTGDLYIADVGQDNFEEVNFQPALSAGGENYGWDVMEGVGCYSGATCDQSGFVLPVFTYPTDTGCSITGGFVYRGTDYPALQGVYFAADYCSGYIWGLQQSGSSWENTQLLDTGFRISSFGEDETGELYLADRRNGEIHRIIETPPG